MQRIVLERHYIPQDTLAADRGSACRLRILCCFVRKTLVTCIWCECMDKYSDILWQHECEINANEVIQAHAYTSYVSTTRPRLCSNSDFCLSATIYTRNSSTHVAHTQHNNKCKAKAPLAPRICIHNIFLFCPFYFEFISMCVPDRVNVTRYIVFVCLDCDYTRRANTETSLASLS